MGCRQVRFGESVVNATVGAEWVYVAGSPHRELELTCIAPRAASNASAGAVRLELSLNAQEYFCAFARPLHPSVPWCLTRRP